MATNISDLVPRDECSVCGAPLPHEIDDVAKDFLRKLEAVQDQIQFRIDESDHRAGDLQRLRGLKDTVGMMIGGLMHGDPPAVQEVEDLRQSITGG